MVGAAEYDADGNLVGFTPGAYVMGLAELDGRPVAIGGDDFTISGGSPHNVRKHPRDFMQPLAMQYGIPYVQLVEGVGHSSKADEAEGHMGLPPATCGGAPSRCCAPSPSPPASWAPSRARPPPSPSCPTSPSW